MGDNPYNKWNNDYQRIMKCEKWDRFFFTTKLSQIKPTYRDIFKGIRAQYMTFGYMSPKQAETAIYALKKNQPKGVSARSFRGLPRMVYEGNY